METENRISLLASHAMWAGDYEGAWEFYTKYLKLEKRLDPLALYRTHFNLAILSTVLEKRELGSVYLERLDQIFNNIESTRRAIRERTDLDIEEIRALIAKQTDSEKIDNLLAEYFPSEDDLLAFFIPPRYARGFLRAVIRNAEMGGIPEVIEEGIFKYTISSELYRVVGKAYSTKELTLEKLHRIVAVKVLIENPNVYCVEDENLRTIAGIQREGLVLCHYLLQDSRDTTGASRIRAFLHNLSEAFYRE